MADDEEIPQPVVRSLCFGGLVSAGLVSTSVGQTCDLHALFAI